MRTPEALTLSAHLLREADKFFPYPERSRRTRTNLQSQKIYETISRKVVEWRGTFAPRSEDLLVRIYSQPVWLDEFNCRRLLRMVPGIVERTRALSDLTFSGISDPGSFAYLLQAANCYLFGLNMAAVGLARAALEDALRERVAITRGRKSASDPGLKNLIDDPVNGLSRDARTLAYKVKRAGDDILHQKVTQPSDALAVIEAARKVILELTRHLPERAAPRKQGQA